jgi:non-ribosomal peptide synthetase component F
MIMIRFGNRVYIDNCFGLCNRLEAFVLACAIRRAFGHEIVLDWPELDALQVAGARRGCIGLWGRWGAVRVRSCSLELFQNLAGRQKIILRGFGGPEEKMAAVYDEAASQLSLRLPLAEQVVAVFQRLGPRPVVGVHLRRGDFPLLSEGVYDLHQALLSAVPLGWYEWVMHAIVQRQPDACFLVCHNGEPEAASVLKKNFDVIEVPVANPYRNDPGHRSARHPVADLFALACCPVILATPVSSFSHYAANVLGNESVCLLPPPRMSTGKPAVVRIRARKRILDHWITACLHGDNEPLAPSLDGVELGRPADFQWLGSLRNR